VGGVERCNVDVQLLAGRRVHSGARDVQMRAMLAERMKTKWLGRLCAVLCRYTTVPVGCTDL
jgi:hypothetical protein